MIRRQAAHCPILRLPERCYADIQSSPKRLKQNMAVKKRGLGRGLDALLGRSKAEAAAIAEGVPVQQSDAALSPQPIVTAPAPDTQVSNHQSTDGTLKHLPIEFIQPGKYQPRIDMRTESLEELAQSIRVQGVMQPIVVRPLTSTKYEIIAGER